MIDFCDYTVKDGIFTLEHEFELVKASMDLIAKTFTLVSLFVLAGVRSVSLVTATWWNLVRGIVNFHVELCWRGLVWIVAFVSLPVKIVTALQRERTVRNRIPYLSNFISGNCLHEWGINKNYSSDSLVP